MVVVFSSCPVEAFQNLMDLSAVPPPEASRWGLHGHQETAFTAAWWAFRVCRGSPWPESPAQRQHNSQTAFTAAWWAFRVWRGSPCPE